jgi:prepilin-type N-terminal cleavage/methylation domain-containing protein
MRKKGFTLMEVMIAVTIMSAAMAIALMSFSAVARAWQKGNSMSEGMSHGDFVMDQLVQSLRSTYYPDATGENPKYGFWLEDDGDMDKISWVKMGQGLTLGDNPVAQSAHRVMFSVEPIPGKSREGASVRLWHVFGQEDDFDYEDVEPSFISDRILGFNCRVATNLTEEGWEWEETWEEDNTNKLPDVVELTLFLEPLEPGDAPFEVTRSVEITVSHLSRQAAAPTSAAAALQQRIRDREQEIYDRRRANQGLPQQDLQRDQNNRNLPGQGGDYLNPYPSPPPPGNRGTP